MHFQFLLPGAYGLLISPFSGFPTKTPADHFIYLSDCAEMINKSRPSFDACSLLITLVLLLLFLLSIAALKN